MGRLPARKAPAHAPECVRVHAKRIAECRECGETYTRKRPDQSFCSIKCRDQFNGRRKRRGAKLYDLIMALRFDRERAQAAGAWSLVCRMASNFAEEDRRERAGRKSWEPVSIVRGRNLPHVATRHRV